MTTGAVRFGPRVPEVPALFYCHTTQHLIGPSVTEEAVYVRGIVMALGLPWLRDGAAGGHYAEAPLRLLL